MLRSHVVHHACMHHTVARIMIVSVPSPLVRGGGVRMVHVTKTGTLTRGSRENHDRGVPKKS
jgi:hypothetical protein